MTSSSPPATRRSTSSPTAAAAQAPYHEPDVLGMLVVLFLFGLIMLEHRAIVSLIPASAGLFKLLGM